MCESLGLHEAAAYWQTVIQINEYSKKKFAQNMISKMFNTVARKKIAILGFTFKKDTTDTRESAAIAVCRELLAERAMLGIYDPKASPSSIMGELEHDAQKTYISRPKDTPPLAELVTITEDVYAACEGAHAIAILTEWEEFRELDYGRIIEGMQKPAFLFDGRRIVDCKAMAELGFDCYQIGRGKDGAGGVVGESQRRFSVS